MSSTPRYSARDSTPLLSPHSGLTDARSDHILSLPGSGPPESSLMASDELDIPPEASLSMRTKLGFGIGDCGTAAYTTVIGFYLLVFLVDVAGIPAGTAGRYLI
jgi:hypothetical protein